MSIVNIFLIGGAVLAIIFSWSDLQPLPKKHRTK